MLPMVDSMVEPQFNQIGIQTGNGDNDDEQAKEIIYYVLLLLHLGQQIICKVSASNRRSVSLPPAW